MSMLKKILHFSNWNFREFVIKTPPASLYNSLATGGVYDEVVDYNSRVNSFKKVLSILEDSKDVLDLACGTGAMIDALPNKRHAKVLGVDVSQGMLEEAKKRFAIYSTIKFEKNDFSNLSFEPASFDLITIGFATRYISKKKEKEFVDNVAKWLRDDGIFVAAVMEFPIAKRYFTSVLKLFKPSQDYNFDMNNVDYFVHTMQSRFTLLKNFIINRQYFIFTSVALVFEKKGKKA